MTQSTTVQATEHLRGESTLVHAIVDIVVRPLVSLLDLSLEVFGQQVDLLELLGQDVVQAARNDENRQRD